MDRCQDYATQNGILTYRREPRPPSPKRNITFIDAERLIPVHKLQSREDSPKAGYLIKTLTWDASHQKGDEKKSFTPLYVYNPNKLRTIAPQNPWTALLPEEIDTTPINPVTLQQKAQSFFNTIESLTVIVLNPENYGHSQDNQFINWTLEVDGTTSSRRYKSHIVRCNLRFIALLFEQYVYSSIPRSDNRHTFFEHLLKYIENSSTLTKEHKKLLREFVDNGMQGDTALSQLERHMNEQHDTFVTQSHDELCGMIVKPTFPALCRHWEDIRPYHFTHMAHALRHVLTMTLPFELSLDNLIQIIIKLGYIPEITDSGSFQVYPDRKNHSPHMLKKLLNDTIVMHHSRQDLDSISQRIRSLNNECEILFMRRSDANLIAPSSGYQYIATATITRMKTKLKLNKTKQIDSSEVKNRLLDIIDKFNITTDRIKISQAHNENLCKDQLRTHIMQLLQDLLLLQPFQEGNEDLSVILEILLCRMFGLKHIKTTDDYRLLTATQLSEKQANMQQADENHEDTPTPLTKNPIIPFIQSGQLGMLEAIFNAGLSSLININHLGTDPLIQACIERNAGIIRLLIDHGAEINRFSHLPDVIVEHRQLTPLQAACMYRCDSDIILFLIREGANKGYATVELQGLLPRLRSPQDDKLIHIIRNDENLQNLSNEMRPT